MKRNQYFNSFKYRSNRTIKTKYIIQIKYQLSNRNIHIFEIICISEMRNMSIIIRHLTKIRIWWIMYFNLKALICIMNSFPKRKLSTFTSKKNKTVHIRLKIFYSIRTFRMKIFGKQFINFQKISYIICFIVFKYECVILRYMIATCIF